MKTPDRLALGLYSSGVMSRLLLWPIVILLVAGLSSAARAETDAADDPRHDVVKATPEGEHVVTRAANGDIIRHRLSYSSDRLVAVIRFRALTKKARRMWIGVPISYRTGGGDWEDGEVELTLRRKGPRQPQAKYHPIGDGPQCAVESRIDYARDRVRLAMPSECIDSPKWIRAFTLVGRTERLGNGSPIYFFDSSPDNTNGELGPRIDRD